MVYAGDMTNGTKIVGYIRVSTDEQRESGAGLGAQRVAIQDEAKRKGWTVVRMVEDAGFSAKNLRRPGIGEALELLDNGAAEALVVAKLDRLSRSLLDFAALMERGRIRGWAVVALDLGLDTTTPNGELMAGILALFAQWERRLIGQRTKDALAIKRREGVVLGRPRTLPASVVGRIARLRRRGHSYAAIAQTLNGEGVGTSQGGRQWYASTVRAVALQSKA
jgi:DNA invertase Pin-like site-specific DNA recombinase